MEPEKFSIACHPVLTKFSENCIDKSILSKLLSYECYWNWIGHKLDEKELNVITDRYISNLPNVEKYINPNNDHDKTNTEETSICTESIPADAVDKEYNIYKAYGLHKDPSIIFIFRAKYYFKIIFWLIYLERYEEAELYLFNLYQEFIEDIQQASSQEIAQFRNVVDKPAFPLLLKFPLELQDIQIAYEYLFDGLHALIKLGTEEFTVCSNLLKDQPKFEKLPCKAQILIMYFKIDFFSKSRQYTDKIPGCYELLMKLDPNCCDWFRGFYNYARGARRRISMTLFPDEKETDAAIQEFNLEPKNPFNLAIFCVNAAEVFKQCDMERKWPLKYSTMVFNNSEEIFEFIKEKVSEIMQHEQFLFEVKGYEVYLNLDSTLSSTLPYKYRDFQFADKCINRALEINPDSSAIKHRKALLILKLNSNSTKAKNQAESILREAANANGFRFNALYDFINILLADPQKNYKELDQVFSSNVKRTEHWNLVDMARLYFLKGCFNLVNRNYKGMIDDWVESYHLNSEAGQFEQLTYSAKRFSWKHGMFNLNYISNQLQKYRSFNYEKVDIILSKLGSVLVSSFSEPSIRENTQFAQDYRRRRQTLSIEEQSHSFTSRTKELTIEDFKEAGDEDNLSWRGRTDSGFAQAKEDNSARWRRNASEEGGVKDDLAGLRTVDLDDAEAEVGYDLAGWRKNGSDFMEPKVVEGLVGWGRIVLDFEQDEIVDGLVDLRRRTDSGFEEAEVENDLAWRQKENNSTYIKNNNLSAKYIPPHLRENNGSSSNSENKADKDQNWRAK